MFDGGETTNSFQLALNLDTCVFGQTDGGAVCTNCPRPDAGDAAGD